MGVAGEGLYGAIELALFKGCVSKVLGYSNGYQGDVPRKAAFGVL